MIISCKNSRNGFSLLEIILYMGLTVFILSALTFFLGSILSVRVKNQTIADVEQQGAQVMQQMTQAVRNAGKINAPAQAESAFALSVDGDVTAKNPVVFALSGNAVTVTEASNPAVPLTSQRVAASNLVFRNLSRNGTPGIIGISFTLNRINPGGRNEYDYTKTFYASVSLR